VPDHPPLSCLKCPALCCKLAGYIEVSQTDIRRLAKFLDLTPKEFEAKHIVEKNRKGEKLIKDSDNTCQFLGPDRRCTVYAARPRDCRGYVCWDQDDENVYDFAKFFQMPIRTQQREERVAASKKRKTRRRRK
jgi:Fe-S-cluster containining protein